ncbi:diguanylate cyclase [Planctomycetota bacterium]
MAIDTEVYRTLFNDANDAQYVRDLESEVFLEVNPAFEKLTGYTRRELVGKLTGKDLTAAQYLSTLTRKMEARRKGLVKSERYEYKIVCKSGEVKPVEISIRKLKIGKQEVVLGSIRDISKHLQLEHTLRDKIAEVGLASTRILTLTEKLRHAASLTAQLLKTTNEREVIKQTGELFSKRTKLGFATVVIYLVKGDYLKRIYPSRGKLFPERLKISQEHFLADFIRQKRPFYEQDNTLLFSIKGRDQILGLIHVRLNSSEAKLIADSPVFRKGYLDFLVNLADSLGLVLENLKLNKELEKLSITDGLTCCYNQRYFQRVLEEEFHRAKRYHRKFSLIMMDVNRFKEINDRFGHQQGNVVLKDLARIMQSSCRKIDVLCRYGGDEFALLLPETDRKGVVTKVRALDQLIKTHRFIPDHDAKSGKRRTQTQFVFPLSVSCGVVTMNQRIKTAEQLVEIADQALFRAKPRHIRKV